MIFAQDRPSSTMKEKIAATEQDHAAVTANLD
jgi:hypothetical protein